MTTISQRSASTLWIMLLTIASMVTTLALACATPFPALAALAAVHMRRSDGIALMAVSWVASQVIGFGVHGYPLSTSNIGWAAALGTSAIGALLAGYAVLEHMRATSTIAQLAAGYMAGFVAFKLIVAAWSLGLGGFDTVFAPGLLAEQFLRNGAILIGLLALYHVLVAIGVPTTARRMASA